MASQTRQILESVWRNCPEGRPEHGVDQTTDRWRADTNALLRQLSAAARESGFRVSNDEEGNLVMGVCTKTLPEFPPRADDFNSHHTVVLGCDAKGQFVIATVINGQRARTDPVSAEHALDEVQLAEVVAEHLKEIVSDAAPERVSSSV